MSEFDKGKKINLELNCYEAGIITGLLVKYTAETKEDTIAKKLLGRLFILVGDAYYK